MDKKKIKWVIAREGLILLGFMLLSLVVYFITMFLAKYSTPKILTDEDITNIFSYGLNTPATKWMDLWTNIKNASFLVVLGVGYLIRFIIWAINTLKENRRVL